MSAAGRRVVRLGAQQVLVGRDSGLPRGEQLVSRPPQVLDQRERQHAGPGPQLADGQWRDALVTVEKHSEVAPLEPAVAVTDEFGRHGVDPGAPGMLAGRDRRQLAIVGIRQVAARIRDLGRDEMEVVEQPFAGAGDEPAGAHVAREHAIGLAQHPCVVVEAGTHAPGAPARIECETRGEGRGAVVETIGAQQFVADGPVGRWPFVAAPESRDHRPRRRALLRADAGTAAGSKKRGSLC
jgi:hypothetical protein